jgi:hypothetical protein
MKPMAEMEWEDWARIIKLVLVGLTAILAAFGSTGLVETEASGGLKEEQFSEAIWNVRNELGEYIQQDLADQAGCDAALEAFSRHREDEDDWAMVLEKCHSEQGVSD